MRNLTRIGLWTLLLAVVGTLELSCSSLRLTGDDLGIEVTSLTYLGAADDGQRYLVGLRLSNSSEHPVDLRSVTMNLRLANEGFIRGVQNEPFTIPAGGETNLTLDLRTQVLSSISQIRSYLQGSDNTLPYVLTGRLELDTRPPRMLDFEYAARVALTLRIGG